MTNKTLSIIIPNYNDATRLERCLNSILEQKQKSVEIIVIDDGSTDNSLQILSKYESQITLLTQQNKGAASARNKGLSIAKGKYIWFVDADDMITADSLNNNFINRLKRENYDVYLFGIKEIKPLGSEKIYINTNSDYLNNKSSIKKKFIRLFTENTFNEQANKIYRKSFLIKNNIKYQCFSSGEDAVFNCSVFSNVNTLAVLKEVKYIYYLFTSSDSTYNKSRNLLNDMTKICKIFKNMFAKLDISSNNAIMNKFLAEGILGIEKNYFYSNHPSYSKFNDFISSKDMRLLIRNVKTKGVKIKIRIKIILIKFPLILFVYLKVR